MVVVIIDDRDPSVIYSRAWSLFNSSLAYNNTISWSGVTGATARISFVGELFDPLQEPPSHPNKGSSIGVYGTTFAKVNFSITAPSDCLYSIDGGTPVRLAINESETGSTQWRQLLFQSPILPEASHVLTIEYNNNQTSLLFLDFFSVNKATPPLSSTTSFMSSITTSTLSTTSQSSSLSPTSGTVPGVATVTVLVQGNSKSELPIGPIIGGPLGALVLICIILLYLRRRQREGHSNGNLGARPLIGKNT